MCRFSAKICRFRNLYKILRIEGVLEFKFTSTVHTQLIRAVNTDHLRESTNEDTYIFPLRGLECLVKEGSVVVAKDYQRELAFKEDMEALLHV